MSSNRLYIHGHLGRDPELKMTTSGKALVRFSVATTERWKGPNGEKKEKTEWHNCYAWAKLAEMIEKFFKKGQEIIIHGKVEYTEETKDGHKVKYTNIRVNDVEFVGSKGGSNSSASIPDPDENSAPPQSGNSASAGFDDEIPF